MPFLAAISPGVLFFLIVGFIGFVVLAAKRHQEKLDQAWTSAGAKLDLSYSTRKSGGSTQRKLVGHFRNLPAKVNTFTEGSGKSKKTYTRYRLRYQHLGLGLELSQQHFFSGLKSALTGRQDIQIGSKEFDDAVIVQGGSSRDVIDYLTRERQLAIQRFLTSKRRGLITDDEASFITNGVVDDAAKISRALESLDALALALKITDEERATPAPPREPEPAIDLPTGAAPPEPAIGDPLDAPLGSPVAPAAAGAAGLAAVLGTGAAAPEPAEAEPTAPPEVEPIPMPEPRTEPATHAPEPEPAEPEPAREPQDTSSWSPPPALELDPALELRPPLELDPTAASRDLAAMAAELENEAREPVLPAATPEPEPAPTAAPAAALDYAAVRADLFQSDRMSYETKEHFEATYAGHPVRWKGKLERLSSFSSDLIFRGSGVKATVELEPFHDGTFEKDVEALVQLPAGTDADLKEYLGRQVVLTGKLIACDGFMRKLMVADGLLEQA